ncbi:unnamed protein product [Moneuplotes crassus]|uniref:Uncharacterized protein n=1 Tax=Euplotes crassus TaxID=5936 RepID=A0AAD1UKH2_EUPCR|nr:unnamed protein product [Moneuplotes crassus]
MDYFGLGTSSFTKLCINNAAGGVLRIQRDKIKQRLSGKKTILKAKPGYGRQPSTGRSQRPYYDKSSYRKFMKKSLYKCKRKYANSSSKDTAFSIRKDSLNNNVKNQVSHTTLKCNKKDGQAKEADMMRTQFILSLKEHLRHQKKNKVYQENKMVSKKERTRKHHKRPGTALSIPENLWVKRQDSKPIVFMRHMHINDSKSNSGLSALLVDRNSRNISKKKQKDSCVDSQNIYRSKRTDRTSSSHNTSVNMTNKTVRTSGPKLQKEIKVKREKYKKEILQNINFVSKAPIFPKKVRNKVVRKPQKAGISCFAENSNLDKIKTARTNLDNKENKFECTRIFKNKAIQAKRPRSKVGFVKLEMECNSDEEDIFCDRLTAKY